MRQLSDGEREALYDSMRDDGAPDWVTLSKSAHTRRKGPIPCSYCRKAIQVGERYEIVSALEDGRFVQLRIHPGICPALHREMSEGYPPEWADQ